MSKLKTAEELSKIVKKLKSEGKTVGMVTGCFDVIHIGHVEFLRAARDRVDVLIVGLDNDETVRTEKGSTRPIHTIQQRTYIVTSIEYVDFVYQVVEELVYCSETSERVWNRYEQLIAPDIIMTNSAYDKTFINRQLRLKRSPIKLSDLKDKIPNGFF